MEVNSLHPGNAVNDATQKSVRTRSKFAPSRRIYQTMRYGELTPHFVMESVPSDDIKLRSSHDIRSYTLKAPIMSDISIKKDYFNVPLQAILPFNADKLYTNPVQGDDVVAIDVNCAVKGNLLLAYLKNIFVGFINFDPSIPTTIGEAWAVVLRQIVILEYFLSSGSLARQLGYSWSTAYSNQYVPSSVNNRFDYVVNQVLSAFLSDVDGKTFEVLFRGGNYISVDPLATFSSDGVLCLNDFFERIRQDPVFDLRQTEDFDSGNDLYTLFDSSDMDNAWLLNGNFDIPVGATPNDFNFCRLAAYQIVCHHFYSNDHIDYIYSAELFRQLMSSYVSTFNGFDTFTYNGVATQYDFLSGYYLLVALGMLSSFDDYTTLTMANDVAAFDYISSLMSFRKSLRYVDYFTGARSQPLAVGDVNVAVNANLVNIVDVTKKLQAQRFLNSVNRAGRKLVEYVSDLFGVTPAYDYHDPAWLAHTADSVHVVENENTGDAQWSQAQSVTGLFRSNAERYSFEFKSDRPSVIIGITYFDIPRCYAFNNDRQNLHIDRFDMFNPYMQFIGDQPEYLTELGVMSDKPFAYTLRHMEYKQSYDLAAGGFVDNLPAFAFVQPLQDIIGNEHISPEWIRSKSYELDRFYLSLTGHTLANYFHFIVVSTNYVDASRPMAYAPSIL